jgi:hypothetical protein
MTREIWAADCETDPFRAGRIPEPFIWGAYNGSTYHEFTDTEAFVDFIAEKECIVYAHNGGKFDWHFILHRLEQFEPLMVISGRLAKFKIGEAEFRDSYNILPMPLSAWEKDEFDYTILEKEVRHDPANWRKIRDYLRNDCRYLYQMVSEYIERYGVNLTQAGTAMKVWQKLCQVKAPLTNAMFYDTIAPFYYGGRVECFETGLIDHAFKVIDINSAYPFAMKHLHPYGDSYNVTNTLPNSRAYIERSFITLSCISKGAFPFRSQTGLVFPNDNVRRTYTITGWEFQAAIDTRSIIDWEIIEVLTFNDSIRFDDYIDHFYDMKSEAKANDDKAGYIFAKLFLNSLYGKFGANPDNYNEYTIVKPRYIEAAEEEGYSFCAEMGPWALCSRPLDETQTRYYNVAVAASITGFVRAYLWRAIRQCKGVMYCDTDSIACKDTGTLELDPTQLGAWDIEANCDSGGIAGKKLYAFHDSDTDKWKTACKGVRLSADQILRVASGEEVVHNPENPSFSLKRGIKFISRKITKSA